ncbi:MAG TPA: hypothetical protein VG125_18730 [Pirellulales bacterium]|nr:hypothetical protein [Pirellulales bacterium]
MAWLQAVTDIDAAVELHMLGRLVDGPGAEKLKKFGRNERNAGLAQAREVFDAAVSDAEHDLRQKWPGGNPKVRFVSGSLVITFYDEAPPGKPDLSAETQCLDKEHLPELLSELAGTYPDDAKDLPDAESLQIRVGEDENVEHSPDAVIEITGHGQITSSDKRPAGEFQNAEQMERARLRTDPYKATIRIVYEIMAEQDNRRNPPREPVLAVEVVTLSFEFRGERWELVKDEKEKPEEAK